MAKVKWKYKGPLKYKNSPKVIDGYRFDSKAEAKMYGQLKILKASGRVEHFDIHPRFRLAPDINYTADFMVFYDDGKIEVIDVKGVKTRDFQIKQKLFNSMHPLAPLQVIDARGL